MIEHAVPYLYVVSAAPDCLVRYRYCTSRCVRLPVYVKLR